MKAIEFNIDKSSHNKELVFQIYEDKNTIEHSDFTKSLYTSFGHIVLPIIIKSTFLFLISVCIGGIYSYWHVGDDFYEKTEATTQLDLIASISIDELHASLDQGKVLILDARSRRVYELGHIPGAVSLPISEFEDTHQEVLNNVKKEQSIVVYCSSPKCNSAFNLGYLLIDKLGFKKTKIFFGGLDAWQKAGYPIQPGA